MPLRPSLAEHNARTGILARLTIGAIGLVLLLAFAGPVILAAVSVLMMILGVFGWLWRFSRSPISDEERQYALICDQLERGQLRVDANRDAGFLPSDRGADEAAAAHH
jgi:hypothetical protein